MTPLTGLPLTLQEGVHEFKLGTTKNCVLVELAAGTLTEVAIGRLEFTAQLF